MTRTSWSFRRHFAAILLIAGMAFFVCAHLTGQSLWIEVASRVLVYSLAAASLDLIVGYAGMVSFGHAMFLLSGGYVVGILAREEYVSGLLQLPAAIVLSAALAAAVGAVVMRTAGIYFILLTLAFSQMLFFVFTGMSRYGGDEGLPLFPRSDFFKFIDLTNADTVFLFVLTLVCVSFYAMQRLVESPFGLVLKGCKENEARMRALGYETFWYKLLAFIISGAICGLAGALLANVTGFVSPEYGSWQRSGELLVMVILGGMGTLYGPVIGAIFLLGLETAISDLTSHWPLVLGPILLLVAIYFPNGLRSKITWGRRGHPL